MKGKFIVKTLTVYQHKIFVTLYLEKLEEIR